MPWIEKIIGPPGTGKTAELIKRVEMELGNGVEPEKLGFYSFTRAAARVAQQRAVITFLDYPKSRFRHFRTLHSEAFRLLKWSKKKVMAGSNLQEFSAAFGYEISQSYIEDEDIEEHEIREVVLKTLGDYLLFFTNWRMNLMFDLELAYRRFWEIYRESLPDGWSPGVVRLFEKRYCGYKEENGLLDFNDMFSRVLEEELHPDLDVLIFDEAQDSSPLQYKVLDFWLQGVKRHYVAGDPDQCIYQWMGTNPEFLMRRPCDKFTPLTQSYRVPQAVYRLATKIICSTDYRARPFLGVVHELPLDGVLARLSSFGGVAFILVRNLYLLTDIIDSLYYWGVPFENLRGPAPFRGKIAGKYLVARRLLRGEPVSFEDLWLLISKIPQKPHFYRGFKAKVQTMAKEQPQRHTVLSEIWEDCFDTFLSDPIDALELSPRDRAYFNRVVEKYGEGVLLKKPQVTIGTIHSVKGMEADLVAICPDMSRKTWLGWQRLPEDEKRVWYVAATRAREGLLLLHPESEYCWSWPKVGL